MINLRKVKEIKKPEDFYYNMDKVEEHLEDLDRGKLWGPFWRIIYRPIDNHIDEYYKMDNKVNNFIRDVFQKNNLATKDAIKKHKEFPGLDRINKSGGLTSVDKIGVYLHSLNPHNRRALQSANNWTDEEIDTALKNLTTEEKNVGDAFLDFYRQLYDRYNETHRLLLGTDMPIEKLFTAIFFKYEIFGKIIKKYQQPIISFKKDGKININLFFVVRHHARDKIKDHEYHNKKISINSIKNLKKYVQEMERFRNLMPAIRDWNKLFFCKTTFEGKTTRLIDVLAEKIGEEKVREAIINPILNITIDRSYAWWQKALKIL